MIYRFFIGLMTVSALCLATATLSADDLSVMGVWETEGGQSRVLIHPCERDERVCGRLIWTEGGKRIGQTILSDFVSDGLNLTGGRIHDPRSGKSYKAKLAMEEPDRLRVKGCWLIFCGNQHWTRVTDSEAMALSADPQTSDVD